MSKSWSKYNEKLVKGEGVLIDLSIFCPEDKEKRVKKVNRLPFCSDQLMLIPLFIKFVLRLPYRLSQRLTRKLIETLVSKISNFRIFWI